MKSSVYNPLNSLYGLTQGDIIALKSFCYDKPGKIKIDLANSVKEAAQVGTISVKRRNSIKKKNG